MYNPFQQVDANDKELAALRSAYAKFIQDGIRVQNDTIDELEQRVTELEEDTNLMEVQVSMADPRNTIMA